MSEFAFIYPILVYMFLFFPQDGYSCLSSALENAQSLLLFFHFLYSFILSGTLARIYLYLYLGLTILSNIHKILQKFQKEHIFTYVVTYVCVCVDV